MTRVGWDHPLAARYYEEFDRRHGRYRAVNEELSRHAALAAGQRILDLAAGLGGTARAALAAVGDAPCRILCVEPDAAMRSRGEELLDDPRVTWSAALPGEPESFDRVLCGAAVWLLAPFQLVFEGVAALLVPGGAFAFTVPSLYLGVPDDPGGGRDPRLLELLSLVSDGRVSDAPPAGPLPPPIAVDALLRAAGLEPGRWETRVRLTQEAFRDLLRIPVFTDWLLSDLEPEERVRRIDEAYAQADPDSWRWEGWFGWTAWKNDANQPAGPTLAGTYRKSAEARSVFRVAFSAARCSVRQLNISTSPHS
jgi:SAM-dependent methyltransferase